MKLNKLFLGLLGVAALTLAACSGDDKYEWATVSGPQVFFSDDLQSQYEIATDGNTINVPICRVDASGSQTVNLQSTVTNDMYSVPSSVTFNAGEKTTTIPVTYDASRIEFGRYDEIAISIADASSTSEWGISEYSFTAGVTAWVKMEGKATYRDDLVTSTWAVDNLVYQVDIERNVVEEGKYRLVNPYGSVYGYNDPGDWDDTKDYYLEIDATDPDFVHIPYTELGVDWSYGMWTTEGYVDYLVDNGKGTIDDFKSSNPEYFGTLKDGIITMPVQGMVFNYGGGLRYANSSGLFAVALPGYAIADYASSVSFAGIFTSPEQEVFAVADITLGPDAPSGKAVVIEASADASAVADAIAAGELEAVDVTNGTVYLPIAENMTGKLQIVLAVVIDGAVKDVSSVGFEYYGGGANPWESLGIGYWVDDIVVPLFTEAGESYAYEVEIQQSTETPGLYRVVNAYAPVAEAFGEEGGNESIEINAEDPTAVYILEQPIGLDFGYGAMSIETDAGFYVAKYGFDTVKEQLPEVFGTLADGVINFPVLEGESSSGAKVNYQIWLYMGSSSYFAGRNGEFQIVLPGATAEVKAKAKAKAKATAFAIRLNGGMTRDYKSYVKKQKTAHLIKKADRAVVLR